jgi:putative transposase
MSDYLRPRLNGATVFFTVALADHGSRLLVERIGALREAVRQTRAERPFAIDAWVVLPDHLHAVWTLPEGDSDFSTRWGAIKARFSSTVPSGRLRESHRARREKAVWQRRFWEHHIRGAEDYGAHMRYCWWNPVKHGLAAHPAEWPYSSLRREIARGLAGPGWADPPPEGRFGEANL